MTVPVHAALISPEPSEHLEIMARTIYGEARGEPFEGQVAVAHVIRNRASRPGWWGSDIKGVCLKPHQFSAWLDEDATRPAMVAATLLDPAYMQCLGIAALVLSGSLTDPTGGATHYHADYVKPGWIAALEHAVTIGHHLFYREKVVR